MSYNGSGTFQINTSGQPVVTGTSISSTVFNALTADLATGLSTAITKDGQTTTTARIPFALGINSTLVTDATNTTSGSIISAGGVGIAKALFVGTTANVAGAVTLGGVATFSAQPIFSSLTASSAVATDASKGLVSVTNTGTGNNVLATSPTLVTPALGTPASGVLTNTTGLPLSTGVTGTLPEANGGTGTTTGYYGFKNRIINGAMVIDQRNAGASVTPTTNSYALDRWLINVSQSSKLSVQQNAGSITPPTGFSNYLGVTSLSAYSINSTDYFQIQQRIEGFNFADLGWGTANAKTVTLSFWVYSSLTGTFGGSILNSGYTRSYPFTYTISSANTWEQKSITIAGDTTGTWVGATNGVGARISINLGVGSTLSNTAGSWYAGEYDGATGATSVVGTNGATFYITGVQLEKGSTATGFDYRPYGTELALCQRYCQKFGGTNAYDQIGGGFTSLTTQGNIQVPLKVTMRATPSVTSSTLLVSDVQATSSSVSSLQIVSGQTNENIGYVTATTTGMTQYRPCFLLTNNSTSGYVIFASEL